MVAESTAELGSLRFEGPRFAGHSLDVECTQELITYRTLVLECAKELWRRANPGRVRLPKGFEEGFRLQFDRVNEGSAVIPLRRVKETSQAELDLGDEFERAAELIDLAIAAAASDDLLPAGFPVNVVPLFRDFGRTLRPDEVLYTRSRSSRTEAALSLQARQRLEDWTGPTYEDMVDVTGEVRMANVGPGAFTVQPVDCDTPISGRFSRDQENVVLDALRDHRSVRLRVKGIAEFSTLDRQMKRFTRIDEVSLAPTNADVEFDETAAPIWERLASIGASAPAETWAAVPQDLSKRVDEAVYGVRDEQP